MHLVTRIAKLIVLPVALSVVIAQLSRQNYSGAYLGVAVFVLGSSTIGLLGPLTQYVAMKGENRVYRDITGRYFSKLVHADLDYFHSNLTGYLTAATRQYVDGTVQLERALRVRYMTTLMSIFFPLGVIMWLDPWLGLVAFGLSLVQATYLIWSSNTLAPLRAKSREVYKVNSGRMADYISNILAVRSSAQEDSCAEQIKEGAWVEALAFTERYTKQVKLTFRREAITVSFFMVLLWLTVQRMSVGALNITTAVIVVTYTTTIMTAIYSVADDLDEHDDLVDKLIPAFEILERKNLVNDPSRPAKLVKAKGAIEFNGVEFAYDGGRPVLQDFSLKIPAGQKVGIVGLSGAGKSTLTKLLLRFNDVGKGSVHLDGIDVRQLKQTDLRRQIAYVPQEPLLLHATIRQNIVLSKPDASQQEIKRAMQMAHAWQFVQQLPDGVDSVVGERGVKLSGGQKQRIAIARAVLCEAPIIVLDEATSALDSESEQIIKNSFAQILKGKTAVVIAHRLSTLSQMDRIVVVEKGRCAEDGTHEKLLALNGIYAQLWRRQQNNAVVEPSIDVPDPAVIV
jgi:ATP-binding cassette subfamily B protein